MRSKLFLSQVIVMIIALALLASCASTAPMNYKGVKQNGVKLRRTERPQCVNNW